MAFTGTNYIINFETNVAPIEAAMQGLGSSAESIIARVRAIASTPVAIPVDVQATGRLREGIESRLAGISQTIGGAPSSAFIRGAPGGAAASRALERQIEQQVAELSNFIGSNQSLFRRVGGGFATLEERAAAAAAVQAELTRRTQELLGVRTGAVQTERANLAATAEDTRLEALGLDSKRRQIVADAENANATRRNTAAQVLRTSRLNALAATDGGGGRTFSEGLRGPVGRSGGLAGFLGGGTASTLRFAIPSLALFGGARVITDLVRQAEELEQIFVRLDAQFRSLGERGLFGGDTPEEQARRATEALGQYREELFRISQETGFATDETAELGQKFIGLFSSIESIDARSLAEQATEITAQFAVITGLSPDETFNDLAGAVRSFAETGEETLSLIDGLTDSIINVSDATGVASGEILDFVGRIGPAAAQAGLSLEEITAIGATALQGSGVGGGALAEQFARVLTGFQGELGAELSDLAIQFEQTFRQIGSEGGQTVADQFSLDNIAAGNVDQVLVGLIRGFDSLAEAQQRQVVASIGSRREGATLAAVLQNASTFTTALGAATNGTTDRQERFSDIIQRLTGQLARLRAEVTVIGQRLFDAGVQDLLAGILDAVGVLVDATRPFVAVLEIIADAFDILPDGALRLAVQIGALAVAFRALRPVAVGAVGAIGPLARLATSARFDNLIVPATAVTSIGRTADVGVRASSAVQTVTRTVGPFSRALGFLGPAALAASVGISVLPPILGALRGESRDLTPIIDSMRESLLNSGDSFALAANRAQEYIDSLERAAVASDDLAGRDPFATEESADNALIQAIKDAFTDSDQENETANTATLNQVAEALGISVDDVLDQLVERGVEPIEELLGELELASGLIGQDTRESRIRQIISDLETGGASDAEIAIAELATGDLEELGDLERFLQLLIDTFDANEELRESFERTARLALEKAVQEGELPFDQSELERRLQSLAGDPTVPSPAIALLNEFPEIFDRAFGDDQQAVVRQTLESAGARLEAGLITQDQFFEITDQQLVNLRRRLDANVRAATDPDDPNQGAVEEVSSILDEILSIERNNAEALKARLDAQIENAALLGQPLEGEALTRAVLAGIQAAPRIADDPSTLNDLVKLLIGAQNQIVSDLVDGADNLEEAQRIIDNFELPPEVAQLLNRTLIEGDPLIGNIFAQAQVFGSDRDRAFQTIAATAESTEDVRQGVIAFLENRIDELSRAILFLPAGADTSALAAQIEAIRAAIELAGGISTQTANDFISDVDISGLDAAAVQAQEALLSGYERFEEILQATGQDQDLGSRVTRLVQTLQDPDIIAGSEEAVDLALTLAELVREAQELTGAELQAFNEAIVALSGTAGGSAEQFATAQVLFQLISDSENEFNVFLSNYLQTGTSIFNGMLQQIAVLVAAGQSVNEALQSVARKTAAELRRLRDAFGATGVGSLVAGELNAIVSQVEALEEAANLAPDLPNIRVSTGGVSTGGGGSSRDDGRNDLKAAIEFYIAFREAQFDLLEAQAGSDAVALAEIEQDRADFALSIARNEVERLQAQADRVRADRSFAEAIQDVFQAQTELAIAVAESAGDVAGALALGVDAAQAQVDFLEGIGAGAAEIARAQAALISAQDAEATGLVQAELDELGFLFNIGDLSREAYVGALKRILEQLDPVSDQDLWRRISLQIKNLEESASQLEFNLPDSFDLPTLYEVRRLNQEGFAPTVPFGFQGPSTANDNRTNTITINVQTGMDWEDAREIIGEAIGADQSVFALNTKRY